MSISKTAESDSTSDLDKIIAEVNSLTWESVKHPSFPDAGMEVNYCEWVRNHCNENLLWFGIIDIAVLSPDGALKLQQVTTKLIDCVSKTREGVGVMHTYGADLYPIFDHILRPFAAAMEPIIETFYLEPTTGDEVRRAPDTTSSSTTTTTPTIINAKRLINHSAHAIGYGMKGEREKKLQLHVDQSDITISLCLGKQGYEGSNLVFTSYQMLTNKLIASMQRKIKPCGETEEKMTIAIPGHILLHYGKHPHRTIPIVSGERYNWVLWYFDNNKLLQKKQGEEEAKDAEAPLVAGAGAGAGAGTNSAIPSTSTTATPAGVEGEGVDV